MASFTPVRDTANKIIDLAPRDEHQPTGFASLLADTMAAVGATPAPAPEQDAPREATRTPAPWRLSRAELAALVACLVLGLALIALLNERTSLQEGPRPTYQPTAAAPGMAVSVPTSAPTAPSTAAPVIVVAWAAPEGLVLGPIPLPLTATARFEDDWLGVPWQGGTVWIRRSDWPSASLDTLPNLAPPTAAPAPLVVYVPMPQDGTGTTTPAQDASVAPRSRPTPLGCWQGPPMVLRPGQHACWRGVPFVLPVQP